MRLVTSLILASSSPRRRLMLAAAGFTFDVLPPDTDETGIDGETAADMVLRLATEKALAVESVGTVVLGADTTVVRDGRVLGKPRDADDAVAALVSLAGRTHSVLSGWALVRDRTVLESGVEESWVTMRPIDEAEARSYVATGEPLDKAGAYALQGRGRMFVTAVTGPRSNVLGLPLAAVVAALHRAGIEPSAAQRRSDDAGEVFP